MTTRKFLYRGPAEAQAPFRVRVLLARLWECDLVPGSQNSLQRLVDALSNAYPEITLELRLSTAAWAEEYLKSDNPALVPFILKYLEEWAQMKGDPVYRANRRLESVARDPAMLLPRPGHRVGRERYAGALDRHHDAGDTTTDGWRAWNHAEAWIKVRHKLVKSLAELVKETEARPYTLPDGEDSSSGDYGGRYQRTWKNLKAIDKAIETIS